MKRLVDASPGVGGRHPPGMTGRECRLTVEGELSDRAASVFDGMSLIHEGGNTVLVGRVRDQPQLQGLLQRVSDLGLTLLSATVGEQGLGDEVGTD